MDCALPPAPAIPGGALAMPNTSNADTIAPEKPAVFHCDKCGFELPVKVGLLGMRVKCPKCGHVGKVLAPLNGHNGVKRAAAGSHVRRCPFCQEVLDDAWFAASEGVPLGDHGRIAGFD